MGITFSSPSEKLYSELCQGEKYLMEVFNRSDVKWKKEFPECYRVLIEFFKKFPKDVAERGSGGLLCSGVRELARKLGVHPRTMMEMLASLTDPLSLKEILDVVFDLGLSLERKRAKVIKRILDILRSSTPDDRKYSITLREVRSFLGYPN